MKLLFLRHDKNINERNELEKNLLHLMRYFSMTFEGASMIRWRQAPRIEEIVMSPIMMWMSQDVSKYQSSFWLATLSTM
jgi:hypothetical protein